MPAPPFPPSPRCPAGGRGRAWRRRRRSALATLALALLPPVAWPQPSEPGLEQRALQAVNDYRTQQGLAALQPDAALTALADEHSQAMAQQRRLSHAGFHDRFERTTRPLCVENLAFNHRQADALLAAWQASPAHHANLLAPRVRQVGIALVDGYLTLLACAPAQATPLLRRR